MLDVLTAENQQLRSNGDLPMKAGSQIAECSLSSTITIQKIFFFKKLIGLTTCNIVGTLYW